MNRYKRAGSLVEFVLVVLMWSVLLSAFVQCCRLKLAQQKALSAAHWAAQLQSTGLVRSGNIDAALNDFFSMEPVNGVQWSWIRDRFDETAASRFYRLLRVQIQAQFSFSPLVVKEQMVIQEASEL